MSNKAPHTLGVLGVRDFKGDLYENSHYIYAQIELYLKRNELSLADIAVVTGGGKGVESIVVAWCRARNVSVRKIPPNIQEYGPKEAFVVRNNHVVSEATEVLVFWDGQVDIIGKAIISAMNQSKTVQVTPLQ
jgi:hypothetical protein